MSKSEKYKEILNKKGIQLDRAMKHYFYKEFYRKDKRFKNFTDFYNYLLDKDFDDFMLEKKSKNYTEEEYKKRRKELKEKYIPKEEVIYKDDFKFYVWIFKTHDYISFFKKRLAYHTSVIVEYEVKQEEKIGNASLSGIMTKVSYKQNKAVKDFDYLSNYIKNNDLKILVNDICDSLDVSINNYKEKLKPKRKKRLNV